MTHRHRRDELCQHSSPQVQSWTVGISNDESHLCSAPQLMKYFHIIMLLLSPITLWYRWAPVRCSEKLMEPGLETRPAGSRSNALCISSMISLILQLEWPGSLGSPTHLCGEACVVEKIQEEWFELILLDILPALFQILMILHFFLLLVSLFWHIL